MRPGLSTGTPPGWATGNARYPLCRWQLVPGARPARNSSDTTWGHLLVASSPDSGSTNARTTPPGSSKGRYPPEGRTATVKRAHNGSAAPAPVSAAGLSSSRPTHTTVARSGD
jgi:hypothetical protein